MVVRVAASDFYAFWIWIHTNPILIISKFSRVILSYPTIESHFLSKKNLITIQRY